MQKAFVLINYDMGSEKILIEQIKNLIGVREVNAIIGGYDIIAEVESTKAEKLKQIIKQIGQMVNFKSLTTLFVIDQTEEPNSNSIIPDVIPEEKKPLDLSIEFEEFEDDIEDEYQLPIFC